MSRYTHAPSKQPPPPITTLSRATESLFEYVDNTITRSFQILEDLLKTHKYRSQKSDILGSRRAYENWVSESNITDTSKRTENRMIALAAPHVLERLVALLTDLDSTLYSAAYHIRKRQVDGRMVDWFVRDVQIALGRVEDFMEEWRGDENGFGADDMRTPMPGDFFDAEELSRGVVQDVEGREIAERIEAEERERAERAKLGDRGGRGGNMLVDVNVVDIDLGASMSISIPINMYTSTDIQTRMRMYTTMLILIGMHMDRMEGGIAIERQK
ncbi:uncharacterized protein BDV14DRAFT_199233 [Aspergillus stella-maris]|uniref:uncharacterized protein n=1 Tax=Aspergillus stella-maris TaxID=1810926 RepID=UPI003CCD0960